MRKTMIGSVVAGFFILACDAQVSPEHTDNRPPNALAGLDQHVTLGDTVVLDGSQSNDPDEEAHLSFLWSLLYSFLIYL